MKKKELFAGVALFVKENGKDSIDRDKLGLHLMQAGAGLALVGRLLSPALKAAGVEVVAHSTSESRKKLAQHIVDAKLKGFTSYKEMREFVEAAADLFEDISEKAILSTVKTYCKDKKLAIPQKVSLGSVKTAIVNYFTKVEKDIVAWEALKVEKGKKKGASPAHSLKGLAAYLEKNVEDMDKDKALHASRMQYTFSKILWDNIDISDLN